MERCSEIKSRTLLQKKKELGSYLDERVKGALVRSRFTTLEDMDAPSAFFFNLERSTAQHRQMVYFENLYYFNRHDVHRFSGLCFYKGEEAELQVPKRKHPSKIDQYHDIITAACGHQKPTATPNKRSAKVGFLREYCITMKPLPRASNILQSESSVYLEWLLPVIHQLLSKPNRLETSSQTCMPLIRALQNGLQKRFGQMMKDPELAATEVLLPKFKTSWTDKPYIIEAGKVHRQVLRVNHADSRPRQLSLRNGNAIISISST
ncbi:hypothetical protein QTP70_009443 [Hemibagrus guttatus]|uniref:Uncharacterized protein n=1 Tax=Hemibagrus guttatus TaxID=175788 RepID=A0AAE0PQW8_9TELE|nr:hypothetical protein QTP70_009443 [Hemibagrus guttatus]